ncbi:NAD(P)H-hydrate epimerase [Planctomonas psychrotolerans]|uniref:NAD(P)H-hydrate epimerase n=1 Tax=Planctomonas psychrotolerans TaxID=2528712 RepID=UPI00123A0EC1|nr:NAD(P)H-hydrate epimerase [Planctomonas psychrotolerans]
MRLGYSARSVREAELPHLAAGEPLMRMASAALAAELRSLMAARDVARNADTVGPRVLLLVGTGNNGGDALFAGAELAAEGIDVALVLMGNRAHEEGLAAALRAGARVVDPDAGGVAALAEGAAVIVDGILGTGTSADPALRGTARELVAAILPVLDREPRPRVVAVDIPSGIDPDDGRVPDPVVLPADLTVTFGGIKAGLLLPPASHLAGDVQLVDIGLGPELAAVEPLVRLPD